MRLAEDRAGPVRTIDLWSLRRAVRDRHAVRRLSRVCGGRPVQLFCRHDGVV